jgi:hypothetical protein
LVARAVAKKVARAVVVPRKKKSLKLKKKLSKFIEN